MRLGTDSFTSGIVASTAFGCSANVTELLRFEKKNIKEQGLFDGAPGNSQALTINAATGTLRSGRCLG